MVKLYDSAQTVTAIVLYPGQFKYVRVELDHSRVEVINPEPGAVSVNGKKVWSIPEFLSSLDMTARISASRDASGIDFSQEKQKALESLPAEEGEVKIAENDASTGEGDH